MDSDELRTENNKQRRKGQSLAEFALTLPFLLLLVFGVIEFARVFQSWVTIQNAARTAARFASTGQLDPRLESVGLDTLVPCVLDDERGTKQALKPIPGNDDYIIEIFSGGQESLFATWYDGENCDPGNDDHQLRRKDILRIVSIYYEARRGAAGLALEPSPVDPTKSSIQDYLYDVWEQPMPRSDQPDWFSVMLCSSRPRFGGDGEPKRTFDPDEPDLRFVTVLESNQDLNGGFYDLPYCVMNEIRGTIPDSLPQPGSNLDDSGINTNNAGKRWLDPGGASDRVTVVILYNHGFITPIGFEPYIRLEARRAAVNEAFVQARAAGALQGGKPSIPQGPTPVPFYSPTASVTLSPEPSSTSSPAPPTPTDTPVQPFSCDRLHVENVEFFNNRFFMELNNENAQATELIRVRLNWSNTSRWNALKADYPDMFLDNMFFESRMHWDGPDMAPNTDSLTEGTWINGQSYLGGLEQAVWEGVFNNGPLVLTSYVNMWDFGGSVFNFSNPSGGPACEIELMLPEEPEPTVIDPDAPTPTFTYTPDCASTQVRVEFDSFQTAGEVRLLVVNDRYVVSPMTSFEVAWIKRSAALQLAKVSVGGINADDGVVVWQGPDASPNTVSSSEGTWLTDYSFPPRSTTALWLDFQGTASDLASAFGVMVSDFNGSWFEIGCGTTGGGGGGGGGGDSGFIFLSEVPTPPPTNTPRPTDTKAPTLTPSITKTPGPPTNTYTPKPPTSTKTPAPATATYTVTPVGLGGGGGTGGSG